MVTNAAAPRTDSAWGMTKVIYKHILRDLWLVVCEHDGKRIPWDGSGFKEAFQVSGNLWWINPSDMAAWRKENGPFDTFVRAVPKQDMNAQPG